MLAAILFLIVFVLLGIFVIFLSRNIEHGEARFDSSGKVMRDDVPPPSGPAKPAQRIDERTPNNETKAKDDE